MPTSDVLTPTIQVAHQGYPGHVSQDKHVLLPGAAVVLDGASDPDEPEGRDGGWYAEQLALELASRLPGSGTDLADLLAESIDQVASVYHLQPGVSPSATVTILRWGTTRERVEGLALSDSVLTIRELSGRIHALVDDTVEQLAPALREVLVSRLAAGHGYDAEHRSLLQAIRAQLHALRNKPGGHWVAEADPAAAHHAQHFTIKAETVQDAALLTDGAAAGMQAYGLYPGWGDLLDAMKNHGPDAVINRVRTVEANDQRGQRWPRAKPSDDATIVYLRFNY